MQKDDGGIHMVGPNGRDVAFLCHPKYLGRIVLRLWVRFVPDPVSAYCSASFASHQVALAVKVIGCYAAFRSTADLGRIVLRLWVRCVPDPVSAYCSASFAFHQVALAVKVIGCYAAFRSTADFEIRSPTGLRVSSSFKRPSIRRGSTGLDVKCATPTCISQI